MNWSFSTGCTECLRRIDVYHTEYLLHSNVRRVSTVDVHNYIPLFAAHPHARSIFRSRGQKKFPTSARDGLRLVGSLTLYVSFANCFAKEPYQRDETLQKRPII